MAEIIEFEDGQLVSSGYVEIDGVSHEVHEAEYEGNTPISAYNLNRMQRNLLTKKYVIEIETAIASDTEYELPCSYIVGSDRLELVLEGIELIKDQNFEEVGEEGTISNTVKLCEIEAGCILVVKVRGEEEQ